MFENREQAGELLARKLDRIIKNQNWVVVALLRGGIILGKKISDHFKIPLFPLAVKKIGAPSNSELAIGAITGDKTFYFDKDFIQRLGIEEEYLKKMAGIKTKEAQVLQNKFKNKISLKNKRVVIVDDGVATGTTVICASIYVRKHNAREIILATPVIGKETLITIKRYFDKVITLKVAEDLGAVGNFYEYFPQVEDEEAMKSVIKDTVFR